MGRRKRREDRTIEAIREELSTADRHARAVLTDAISQVELRLGRDRDDRERAQLLIENAIENSRSAVTAQAMDVARLLEQVANTCALVSEQIEADRAERRALTQALAQMARQLPAPPDSRVHALGGTVFAAPEVEDQSALPATESLPATEHEVDVRESSDPWVDAEDVSSVVESWAVSKPADETIDLREPDEPQFTSRRFPRWPPAKRL